MAEGLSLSGIETNIRGATTMTDHQLLEYLAMLKVHIAAVDYSPVRQQQAIAVWRRAGFEVISRFLDGDSREISPETRAARTAIMLSDLADQSLELSVSDGLATVS